MSKKFKFEKVLKNLVDFYDEGFIKPQDYPEQKLWYNKNFLHNQYTFNVKVYDCIYCDIVHTYFIATINNRIYSCLSFDKKGIDVILDFLYSCLELEI